MLRINDKFQLIDLNTIYPDIFFTYSENWEEDVRVIVKTLYNEYMPSNVIDFGCAVGFYMREFLKYNVDAFGIDGCKRVKRLSLCHPERIEIHDLRIPLRLNHKYDLAICFEVAEHIHEKYEDILIDTITSASDQLAFTAASPGQGGFCHINEKPHRHWIKKIESRGFKHEEKRTYRIRKQMKGVKTTKFISKNLLLFRKET